MVNTENESSLGAWHHLIIRRWMSCGVWKRQSMSFTLAFIEETNHEFLKYNCIGICVSTWCFYRNLVESCCKINAVSRNIMRLSKPFRNLNTTVSSHTWSLWKNESDGECNLWNENILFAALIVVKKFYFTDNLDLLFTVFRFASWCILEWFMISFKANAAMPVS